MRQLLAAVRLRLDNLFIKESIFDHRERCVNRTLGARSTACGDADRCGALEGTVRGAVRGMRRG
jgi:hypothetical protein